MACEFGYINAQTLPVNGAAILEDVRTCKRRPQLVMHDNMTPNINLRGLGNGKVASAQYNVRFSGNIAVAAGGTVGEIDLALSVDGYVLPLTLAAATPAAIGDNWHVSGDATIEVPSCCCKTVTVVNASTDTAITVQNLGVEVTRIA